MLTFNIFFNDLNPEAQKELMDLLGISDLKEANWDMNIMPLATIEIDEEDE